MEGLNQIVGHAITARIDNEEIQLDGLSLADMASIESELLARRPNLLRLAVEASRGEPDNVREFILHDALVESKKTFKVTEDEYSGFVGSPDGECFMLYLVLERRYPGRFSRDRLWRWRLARLAECATAIERLMIASGLDSRGNEQGPTAQTGNQSGTPAPAGPSNQASPPSQNEPSESTGAESGGGSSRTPTAAAAGSRRVKRQS